MPGYRAHVACAVVLYGGALFVIGGFVYPWCMVLGGFIAIIAGALFPDIDIKSKGQHYLYRVYAVVLAIILYLYWLKRTQIWIDLIICVAIITIAPMLARHRGITHSPRFICGLGLGAWIIGAGLYPQCVGQLFFYCACFVLGALSHVWLDRKRIFFLK